MMAPADALQFLLKGDQLRLNRAKAMKLVDAVVPAADLIKAAKDWIKASGKAKAPWDVDGFRLPGGPVYSKAGMMTFPAANAIYRRETYDNYPAARAILQVVYEGLLLPIDRALTVESRYFTKILRSPEAAAMIRSLFVSMQDLNKGARRPANVPPAQIKKVGIIGAGFMGAGIASVSAQAGLDVVLIDRDQESADKGKAHVQKSLTDQVNKGRATAAQRDAVLARITATADYGALAGCDLVVEAVFEDRKVKAEATAKAQAVVPDVMFGSNTSTLPITSLAETAKDPAKFIGIHFFSPVERMMLVEIIVGKKTGDAALATGARFRARDPQDADRGQRLARLLHLARGRHLSARRPSDAGRGHSGGDDRERRPHGRHAGRPAVAQRRGGGRSRPGRSSRRPRPISAPRRSIRGRRRCWRRWSRSTAGSAARTARASTTIRRRARRSCGRASPSCSRRSSIPTRSTCRSSRTGCSPCRRWRPRAASRRACSPTCARPTSARSWASASRRSPAARCPTST